ncbi:L-lactate dehydrogenase [cytochrome] [Posidoniimonas corsicana]|uniref:L-lactate dehydrogenase [cytochrome] n=1 Tax=Posidoniimonas corsicana TaxID=1938618 RepID=A0A5C5V4P3_9BACT|nr:alpha-hydroxy acid oxidase [Posidoniimonas corsicana]TWT33508.1 L-lactate dehydrogenase [cytochrome] [Posidoniimonas corsicana]
MSEIQKAGTLQKLLKPCHDATVRRWTQRLDKCFTISDLKSLFEKRIPPVVGDYFLGGASDERTLRENEAAFERTRFAPNYGIRYDSIDTSTTVAGTKVSMPIIAAPVGSLRTVWPHGEAVAAKAVGEAGTICTLSTLTGTRLEEVRAASPHDCWFQLYLVGGQEVATKAIERAKKAGYTALVLTIDTPVAGLRYRDMRNGSSQAINGGLLQKMRFAPQMSRHLSWLTSYYHDGGLMDFPNIELPGGEPMPYADIGNQLQKAAVTWDDIQWIRDAWQGPIIVKGVHTLHDAQKAADVGAAAIVVSNHGGRQLDRVLPTLDALREIAPHMKDRNIDVLMDGGIRSGGDVAIAIARGAKAVLIGRAYTFGLGTAGHAGVSKAFSILRSELEHTMRQLGCASLAELDESYLRDSRV